MFLNPYSTYYAKSVFIVFCKCPWKLNKWFKKYQEEKPWSSMSLQCVIILTKWTFVFLKTSPFLLLFATPSSFLWPNIGSWFKIVYFILLIAKFNTYETDNTQSLPLKQMGILILLTCLESNDVDVGSLNESFIGKLVNSSAVLYLV